MKATYMDFIEANKNCSGFINNEDMQELFDLLNEDEKIIKMIESSDVGKPALAGCVGEVEAWYKAKENCTIDFEDPFTRTVVGRLVKTVIAPFGYEVTKQKDFTKESKGEFFTSASCYKYNPDATITMKIVKMVVEA